MAAGDVQRLDLKDLDALLLRAKEEGWTELALLGLWRPGAWAQQLADKLIREGWSADRVFLFNEKLDRMPPALASLTGLNSLNLWGNQIGDQGAKAIASLTGLTSLDLANNRIGDAGAKAIASLSGLTALDLNHNTIGDAGAESIARLTALTTLDLYSNDIGPRGAKSLSKLDRLTSLNLGFNSAYDEGTRWLAKLENLVSLNLAMNGLGDDGIEALRSLPKLKSLNLRGNVVGDRGATVLAQWSTLTELNITECTDQSSVFRTILDGWALSDNWHDREHLKLTDWARAGEPIEGFPTELIRQSDAQALIAAWRRFKEQEAGEAPLPEPEAAGEPVMHGVQVGTAADGRLTLVDPTSGAGARDDKIGRELHAEVIAALDRLIAKARQSNVVAEWREAAESAKERLGSGPPEVRVSAVLRIERLRALREADDRRRSEPDPLVEPAEAEVAAELDVAVRAANSYVAMDPYLASQQRLLADPSLEPVLSLEEAAALEADLETFNVADEALLTELREMRETASKGGQAGRRARVLLDGSDRNILVEALRRVLDWLPGAMQISFDSVTTQVQVGAAITVDDAAQWLAAKRALANRFASEVGRASATGARLSGRTFAISLGTTGGPVVMYGLLQLLENHFALLSKICINPKGLDAMCSLLGIR